MADVYSNLPTSTDDRFAKSIKELTTIRDNFLIDLLKLKNKYKI